MLPEGWKIREVGEIFEVQLGKMLSPTAKELSPQLPYLTNFNVRWGSFDLSRLNSMHFSERDKDKFSLKLGDLLMCEGGEVGRCAIWNHDIECYYQKALHRLRSKGPISNIYFQQYMNLVAGSKLLEDYTSRTSIAHLTREKLLQLPVRLPPQEEQNAIAQILSTWDQAIATTEKLIENSKAQKKALMQQLLTGKKRLPGFSKDWQEYRLGQLFKERKETKRLDLRLLSITQDRGVIYRDDVGRKDTSSEDKSKYKRLCPNDIGYNTMRMWQGVSALSDKEGIVSPAYTIASPGEQANPLYMSYLFKLPKTIHNFYRHSQGLVSDTWNLKYPNFSEIKVTVPGTDEQEEIASVLKTADKQISNLRLQAEKLNQEKKALMQQLLTGKRRVKVDP